MNTVSQVDTILVTFHITETQYLAFTRYKAKNDPVEQTDDGDDKFELILVDGSLYGHKGRLDFVDREVDTTTGAMLVQASFPNPEGLLRPGQFSKVRIKIRVVKDAIMIPQRCVMETQGLHSVFVVDSNNTIQTRDIQVGDKVGSSWMITEGLKPGEKVVYEGLQKVKDGAIVKATAAQIEPTGEDKK